MREFGILLLKDKIWVRHKSFKKVDEINNFLSNTTPSDVYYSSAYYDQPATPEMGAKGWNGADLIFDIDADHIFTSCGKIHDTWICKGCNFVGKGISPDKCPDCEGERFDVKSWTCGNCLNSAKAEVTKLLEILTNDFGFSNKEINLFFSGNRGYHIHVEGKTIKTLDSVARKEIVDFVTGLGLDLELHGFSTKKVGVDPSQEKHVASGWQKRIVLGLKNLLLNIKKDDLPNVDLSKTVLDNLKKNEDSILKHWLNTGTLPNMRGMGIGSETRNKIFKYIGEFVKMQAAQIDTVVTTDIHRLIRLGGTLHGKTGFKKLEFSPSTIDTFDPFKDAIAFKEGFVTVFVFDAPEFRLGEEIFGPYVKQKVELPTAAALLLILQGRAEVVK
jgi:DNA primase small subunit